MTDTLLEQSENPQNKKKSKIVKKIIVVFLSVVFSFLLLAMILAFFFQDKIADMFLTQLYKYTKVEIEHKSVSFSLIRKFPMASLQVNGIQAKDLQGEHTLLKADKIFLQFSILDLARNNYTIRRIDISDADLHLIINEKGENNWNIFQLNDSVQPENVSVRLSMIQLHNVNLLFEHNQQKITVSTAVDRLSAKGNFSDNIFSTNISSNVLINEITRDTVTYLRDQEVQFYTKLNVNTEESIYSIEGGNFDLDILKFIANITLSKAADNYALQMRLSIKHANIERIMEKLPNRIRKETAVLKPMGILSATIDADGEIGRKNNLKIHADFECKNGSIENVENEIKLSKINMKGHFSTRVPNALSASEIVLDDFSAKLNQGYINGMLELENLEQPFIALTANGKLNLEDLHSFLPTNYFYNIEGNMNIDISFKNKFTQLKKITAQDFKHSDIQGNLVFTNVLLQMRENENILDDLSGSLRFNNQIANADKLKGKLKDNTFELNGKIENIFPYILDEGSHLQITANLYLPELNINKLLAKEPEDTPKTKKEEQGQELSFPADIDFDFTFKADALSYNQFKAQNTAGKAILNGNILKLENLQLNTCDGKILAKGSITQQSNKDFSIRCTANLSDMNIQKLFYAFNNFGQKNLTDKNIKGIAYSDVTFGAVLQKDLTIIPNSITTDIDITVKNGELNNFVPLESLSKFVELDELRNVQFATLANQINIEKSTITIPVMEIKNNALNISLWGKHTFSGDIDYHIKLLLKDVLSKKVKNKKGNEDFGEVVDDNTGNTYLHLLAIGNVDNPKFKWDSPSAKKGLQQQFSDQKRQIQEIRERNDPQSSSPAPKEKELNDSKKKQKEIEIGEDW